MWLYSCNAFTEMLLRTHINNSPLPNLLQLKLVRMGVYSWEICILFVQVSMVWLHSETWTTFPAWWQRLVEISSAVNIVKWSLVRIGTGCLLLAAIFWVAKSAFSYFSQNVHAKRKKM